MRTILLTACLMLFLAPSASPYIDSIDVPAVAEAGEPIVPVIMIILADSCWFFDSYQVLNEDPIMVIDFTIQNNQPWEDACPGPESYFPLAPEIVFPRPGRWTLRVIEHAIQTPFSGEDIWDLSVEVTEAVAVDAVSWGAIKASFR